MVLPCIFIRCVCLCLCVCVYVCVCLTSSPHTDICTHTRTHTHTHTLYLSLSHTHARARTHTNISSISFRIALGRLQNFLLSPSIVDRRTVSNDPTSEGEYEKAPKGSILGSFPQNLGLFCKNLRPLWRTFCDSGGN